MTTRLCFILFLVVTASCNRPGSNPSGTSAKKEIRLRLLPGPSALAFSRLIGEKTEIGGRPLKIEWAGSPEIIQAQLIRGEADIAVVPMINAVNLYNKGVGIRLTGCPVWGTLYLVSRRKSPADTVRTPAVSPDEPVYLFGAGTTPDILARHYLAHGSVSGSGFTYHYTFPTVREIVLALLAGKANTAVLSEPFLSQALRSDSTLFVAADLNQPSAEGTGGFPQTAVVIAPGMEAYRNELDSLLRESCRFTQAHPAQAIRLLEEQAVFPPGLLSEAGVGRCMIRYRTAREAESAVRTFLEIVYAYEPKAIGGRLPDAAFFSVFPAKTVGL